MKLQKNYTVKVNKRYMCTDRVLDLLKFLTRYITGYFSNQIQQIHTIFKNTYNDIIYRDNIIMYVSLGYITVNGDRTEEI